MYASKDPKLNELILKRRELVYKMMDQELKFKGIKPSERAPVIAEAMPPFLKWVGYGNNAEEIVERSLRKDAIIYQLDEAFKRLPPKKGNAGYLALLKARLSMHETRGDARSVDKIATLKAMIAHEETKQ